MIQGGDDNELMSSCMADFGSGKAPRQALLNAALIGSTVTSSFLIRVSTYMTGPGMPRLNAALQSMQVASRHRSEPQFKSSSQSRIRPSDDLSEAANGSR